MKKVILIAVVCVAMVSCGSQWQINGNKVEIEVCKKDTVVPAGSILLTPKEPLKITLPTP